MQNTSVSDWWELRVDDEVVTCILGRDRAEWFLANMKEADPGACWELVLSGKKSWTKPMGPHEVQARRKVVYCVGSD